MTSRDMILSALRTARPPAVARPDLSSAVASFTAPHDLVRLFTEMAESAGAQVRAASRTGLSSAIDLAYPATGRTVSALGAFDDAVLEAGTPHSFADTELFICEAVLGVAENGAVWLPLSRLRHRSAVFLATNVLVVLNRARIVASLHDAYAAIDVSAEGFGVFVAGPSKTADIEQALVVGAHGAMSVTILLVDD